MTCSHCRRPAKRSKCGACLMYERRRGVPRPESLIIRANRRRLERRMMRNYIVAIQRAA